MGRGGAHGTKFASAAISRRKDSRKAPWANAIALYKYSYESFGDTRQLVTRKPNVAKRNPIWAGTPDFLLLSYSNQEAT